MPCLLHRLVCVSHSPLGCHIPMSAAIKMAYLSKTECSVLNGWSLELFLCKQWERQTSQSFLSGVSQVNIILQSLWIYQSCKSSTNCKTEYFFRHIFEIKIQWNIGSQDLPLCHFYPTWFLASSTICRATSLSFHLSLGLPWPYSLMAFINHFGYFLQIFLQYVLRLYPAP